MQNSRTERAAKGYLINVLQSVFYMALQGALAPVILRMAGAGTLGAYGAVMQAVAYYSVLDFSLSMTVSRYLAQCHGQTGAESRFRAIFATGRTCLLFSGLACALVALAFAGPFAALLKVGPPLAQNARLAVYLLGGWFILRTPIASYDAALMATQNLATAHTITGVQNAARVLGSLAAVLLGAGLVGMVSAAICADLAAGTLYRRYFMRIYPERAPGWGFRDRQLFRRMFSFALHALAIQMATMLTFASGQLMAGYLAGAVGVSIIYTNQLPAQMAYNLILRLADNAAPAVNELKGRDDAGALRQAFFRIHRLTLNLSVPLALGILLFNRTLISKWVGPAQYGGAFMTAALAGLTVVVSIEHVNVVFAMALGLEKVVARFAAAEAVIALTLAFLLGRAWGLGGIPAGVALAIGPKTFYLFAAHGRTFQFGLARYCAQCFLPAASVGSAALAVTALAMRAAGTASLPAVAAGILLFLGIYGALSYSVCLRPDERSLVRRYAGQVLAQVAGAR